MGKENIEEMKTFNELVKSNTLDKFQKITDLILNGLGEKIYKSQQTDIPLLDEKIYGPLTSLSFSFPREILYVWVELKEELYSQELKGNKKLPLGTLYFAIADILFRLDKAGYGKYYLMAYLDDIWSHAGFDNAPASQALRVRCYLGQKGLEQLKGNLSAICSITDIEQLKSHLKNMDRAEFESLVIKVISLIPLEGNEDFFVPKNSLRTLINTFDSSDKSKRGSLLEKICEMLFGSITGFIYRFDERSTLLQLDGLIYNYSNNPLLYSLGKTIIVEAKAWFDEKIGRAELDIIAMNMLRLDSKCAFLVTSQDLTDPAKEEMYHEYIRTGNKIIWITYDEIQKIADNKLLLPMLISERLINLKLGKKFIYEE